MLTFILRRVLWSIPVLIIVISATFLAIRIMPGSPFMTEKNLDPDIIEQQRKNYGLDGSLPVQLGKYWGNLLQGNLGPSLKIRNRTTIEILGQCLPKSFAIGFFSLWLALGIGIVAGSFAAIHHNSITDRLTMLTALLGICLPSFVIAPFFVLLFAIVLGVFPVAGWGTPGHLVLPVLCLALPYGAYCSRLMRTSMLETLGQDFIRTARAKGLSNSLVIYKHALKMAILPLISFAGPLAAHILTGSIVIETIFKIPGLGFFFVNSIFDKDVYVAGGCVIVYCTLLVTLNLVVDVLYTVLDRRVQLQ